MHAQSFVATLFASVTGTGTGGATAAVVVVVVVGAVTIGAITFGNVMAIRFCVGVVVVGAVVVVTTGTVTGIANPVKAELDNLTFSFCACALGAP